MKDRKIVLEIMSEKLTLPGSSEQQAANIFLSPIFMSLNLNLNDYKMYFEFGHLEFGNCNLLRWDIVEKVRFFKIINA